MTRVDLILHLDRIIAPMGKPMITQLSNSELTEIETEIGHLFTRLKLGDRFPARAAVETEERV